LISRMRNRSVENYWSSDWLEYRLSKQQPEYADEFY